MPAKSKKNAVKKPVKDEVADYLAEFHHPLKRDIETARKIVLGANRGIGEGIKWNSLSFRTTEYFATLNWRNQDAVEFIFHTGAKAKGVVVQGKIADPKGLARWLAPDRCQVTIGCGKALSANKAAFVRFIREWIQHV